MSIAGSNVGGTFPWQLTPVGGGNVRVNRADPAEVFSPLDLYVMGLLPADSVPDSYVLAPSVNVTTLADGVVVPGAAYTVAQYIAAHGARAPASGIAPREFAAAVVVLSVGRLLTPTEMAFFDHASARGETTVPLDAFVGRVRKLAAGLLTATGGRATLRTRLPF
jgi:hypothetical protein